MLNVRRMKPFGHELLCVLADEFFARISKEFFGLRVDKLNMSRTVDNHHRVGRGFEQVSKLFLFSDALRNVAVAFENACRSAAGIAPEYPAGRHDDFRPATGTVGQFPLPGAFRLHFCLDLGERFRETFLKKVARNSSS